MSASVIVGIADCAVSNDPNAVIVTYALGSCIGIAIHDPVARVGGLLHYMLPMSVLGARSNAENRPYMYCDSGLPLLLQRLQQAGAQRNRLSVRAAGGAQVLDDKGFFNIGNKNQQILKQLLLAYKLPLAASEFGGNISRTVGLEVGSGKFWIKRWLLGEGETTPQLEHRELLAR